MPSPLKGLIEPAASPTTRYPGPTRGPTDMPIGSRPPVGAPHAVARDSSQEPGAVSTNAAISPVVLPPAQRSEVESSPTPTFTRPAPSGKIQPYPGRT